MKRAKEKECGTLLSRCDAFSKRASGVPKPRCVSIFFEEKKDEVCQRIRAHPFFWMLVL